MRSRSTYWILLCLLCVAGAWFFWPRHHQPASSKKVITTPTLITTHSASTAPNFLIVSTNSARAAAAAAKTNKFAYRLSNTSKTIGELEHDRHAILLENALIDTGTKLDLSIPKKLQAQGDPGAYIVQARGPIDNSFRAMLAAAGAQIISYIPNDAYLVSATASVANEIASGGFAVLPYEPYYKVQSSLMPWLEKKLPDGATLTLGLFPGEGQQAIQQIKNAGGQILSQDGDIVRVVPPEDWTTLAQLPQIHIVELSHKRATANDLARMTMGISVDTVTVTNYLNLSGSNVVVEVNDSGIDVTHPDFLTGGNPTTPGGAPIRVTGDSALSLVDTNGHGTHVAGIIAGNGSESYTVTNTPQGSVTNADFRGKAPAATLFSVAALDNEGGADIPDSYLQEVPARTNALISNNSWGYADDTEYDLAAASYDAAVRDALPALTGSQPVLFVFAAGNSGAGDDNGGGGSPDTISSPGTAKNVISVGALEQLRFITNIVTDANGNSNATWQAGTDSGDQVASYSSRGNVGIGTEGTFGRFKPDVVAPGSFVVSTRSSQWDQVAYYNPTNFNSNTFIDQTVDPGTLNYYNATVPANAVGIIIQVVANNHSAVPFPTDMPIYVSKTGFPTTTIFDILTTNDEVSIPPNSGIAIAGIQSLRNSGFNFAVGDSQNAAVNYDLITEIITTNGSGNYFQVLSNLNNTIAPWYRYESGTSMAAAAVSGLLALIQDYFTNQLAMTPSPALLKAMVINGSQSQGSYDFAVTNGNNLQGWGLPILPSVLPPGITNQFNQPCSEFFLDQNPTNALATGDSHTFTVNVSGGFDAQILPLRVTLVWTDPSGDPSAAIKLVNNLDIVVTNLDTGDFNYGSVYLGNNFDGGSPSFSVPVDTNAPPSFDSINNVKNIVLSPLLGASYSVTVIARDVNVNAVTAQTNGVVQDYALVISCGEGEVTNAITVTDNGIVSNPTSSQQITVVTSTNSPLFNQIVGASSPLLGTNTVGFGTNAVYGTNALITVGMTNQWHFYIVTNNGVNVSGSTVSAPNAAFLTFFPETLSIPRLGVLADSAADATRPEADIDMYVSTDSSLTNLNPLVISNCVNGTQVGASAGLIFNGASLGRSGTEFVADTNSQPGQVYYIGVKSEDREAAEYDFLPVFSQLPFSAINPNGSQTVNGLLVPQNIPDGSPAHPGIGYVFALALYPMEISDVVVSNQFIHQNFGDLIGTLNHNGITDVLNNHDSLGSPPGPYNFIYDDSGQGIAGSQPSDGPGSLNSYVGTEAIGPWILTEVDDALTQTGSVTAFSLNIQPNQDLKNGFTNSIPPNAWFYDFIDVPAGFTNLTIAATNVSAPVAPLPLVMYTKFGAQPKLAVFDQTASLTNCLVGTFPTGTAPGNAISTGPPLPPGRYFVGIFNTNNVTQQVYLLATLGGSASVISPTDYTGGQTAIPDDATTSASTIQVTNVPTTATISSLNVGIVVNHPRISDLTFTLVSPTGQRVLLMENRGGTTTNGAGYEFITTNSFAPIVANGGQAAQTNYLDMKATSGSLTINYNMFTVPDEMTVYYSTNIIPANLLFDTGFVSGTGTITVNFGPGTSTFVTIIMNQFTNPSPSTAWTYTAGGEQTNFNYLTFTEDTNLTTTPIKYAVPPYTLNDKGTNYILSDFELATNGVFATNADYFAPTNIYDPNGGWNLPTNLIAGSVTNLLTNNQVSVVTDPATAQGGSNFLALANGTITRTIPMTVGRQFSLSYQYRGPGISGWWRGDGNATDSSDPETNGNNGELIGRFNFPAGEVGQSFEMEDAGNEFQFAGTNTYVQIHQPPFLKQVVVGTNDTITVQSSYLDVGAGSGLTIEGWINPTNVSFQQPLVEWLARVPTNAAVTNLVITAGPFLDPATGHYYYLLGSTNWTTSEFWAQQLGGHLATIDTANEQNWVFDTFAEYGGTNRNLWIGLNDQAIPGNYVWSSGAPFVYANWLTGEPTNCDTVDYFTTMLGSTNGQPGLWVLADDAGHNICNLSPTNKNYGVVEVDDLQPNGVQFWISVTNSPATASPLVSSNGCLYANLVDITNGAHEIFSAPGLIQSNVFQHVALTYNTNSGLAVLYYNGTNVASTNLGIFKPKTTGDVLLGKDMSRVTNNFYGGEMDEMSIYARALSASEIAAIYRVSASTTNRNLGKFDPTIPPEEGLAEAQVSLGGTSNIIYGANNRWQMQSFSFVATTNSLPMQISGIEPGILLDTFAVSEAPLGNLYYLPEQSLASLDETTAYGTWTLQIWDNRAGAYITNAEQLVSWQLQVVLATNTATYTPLNPQQPGTIIVPPGEIVYLSVAVPTWATAATNILVSATAPVDLLYNQTIPPTGSNPGDVTFLTNQTNGLAVLNATSIPPLTNSYILGVRNTNSVSVTAVVEVDYDITALTNGIPYTGLLNTNDSVRYFAYTVSSNAIEATFQLLQLSSNADLVLSKGPPLPTLSSDSYGSFNAGNVDENIYVLTNSAPVPLSPGTWYLGVFKRAASTVNYTVLVKERDATGALTNGWTTIDLTNNVPFNFTSGPGAALTNFFRFTTTNFPASIRFELFNLSGNGDLTMQTNAPPLAPPFFQSSQQAGRADELIYLSTNSSLSSLNAQWYLGVPNHESNSITYTILVEVGTNGVFPTFPTAEGAGAGALGGGSLLIPGYTNDTVYHVVNLNDSGPGSLRDAVSSTNRTVVFDVSGTINLMSPLVITNSYLTIAGQTAPGGITVVGDMTTVQSAHDVIIRYLRFRSGGGASDVFSSGFEKTSVTDYTNSQNVAGWTVLTNQVSVVTDPVNANQGNNFLALANGIISNNLPTLAGQIYTLSFAYRGPGIVGLWRGENNALDNINGNNGTPQNITYSAGEVGQAFNFNGSSRIQVSASSPLNVGLGGGFTLDTWINPTTVAPFIQNLLEWNNNNGSANTVATHLEIGSDGSGVIHFNLVDTTYTFHVLDSPVGLVTVGNLQHIVATYNKTTGGAVVYRNGAAVANTNFGTGFAPQTSYAFWLGERPSGAFGPSYYNGLMDEVSVYNRSLSASEIKAIYQDSTNGKFDPVEFTSSPTLSLAKAFVTIPGVSTNTIWGNNTNWQIETITFTATKNGTPVQISGLEPGILLDSLSVNSGDSLQLNTVSNVIADHISAEWSANDDLSVLNSTNVTVQWSVLSDSLHITNNPLSSGSLLRYGGGTLSFHHNLYADNYNANPRLGDNLSLDFVNNVIYDWGTNAGYSLDDSAANPSGFTNQLNYVCNYFIASPNSVLPYIAFNGGSTNTWIFQTNNFIDSNTNGILDGANTQWGMFTNLYTPTNRPFALPPVDTDEAFLAYEKVLDFAGTALFARDVVDANIVTGVRNQSGTIISTPPSGPAATLSPAPPLDSDQDGIPDYWEMTFTTNVYVPSNNNDRDGDGYSDLEEYLNWLGAPHALTLTNTPVGVDLYKLAGNTGNLSFSVTNGVHGFVYLTNVLGSVTNTGTYSNSFAIFTPTNAPGTNFSGYASFDFNVTNNDTIAYFGPMTVSVMVSAVPVLSGGIVTLTNMIPYGPVTNLDTPALGGTNSIDYYVYDVSTNAIGVEFLLFGASSNVVLYATYGLPLPPAPGYPNYSTNAGAGTNVTILVLPGSSPLPLKSGDWYLSVSNATGGPVTYTIEAIEILTNNFTAPILSTNPPSLTNDELVPITVTNTATDTNAGVTLTYTVTMTIDTNAMNLLMWTNSFANTTNTAPAISTNGIITWTPSESQGPGVYTITTVVTDNGIPTQSATNSFDVTVNETNMSPFWPPGVPSQTNYIISPLTLLTVTDTATDLDIPPNPLTYQLFGPSGAMIDTNTGVITWTPTPVQAGNTYTFTNVVTDSSPFAVNATSLSATNFFTVTVVVTTPPFAFTQPATAITGTNAQLNGMATANGLPATAWFQWGTDTNYGFQTAPISVGTSFNVFYTAATITNLLPNVPYHFRLVVTNSLGVAYGFDQILDEANVVAWGANYLGQGNVPSGWSNVVAIAGAYNHSLALKNNETVTTWGDNTFGQTNVPPGLNNNLMAVAGGESFSIALKNGGTVVAWGGNSFPGETNVPPGLNSVVTIASGQYSSLALKNSGSIVAWGANISGLTNVPASLSNNAVAVAGGSFHSLAIKNDGTVVAWGDNSAGQTSVPAGLTNVVAISAGSFHSLALKANGTVVAWGDDSDGQTNVPAGLNNVVAIAAGGFHNLALKSDGTITAWGDNSIGQGSVPPGLTSFVAIAAGYLHSLALTPQSIASLTNVVLNLTNGVAESNSVPPGGITYYKITVPANADFATNILFNLDTSELVNVWFTTNSPPTIATNATLLLVGSTNATSSSVLSTASMPTNIVPGGTYYLAVQNTNSSSAFYAIEVDFHLVPVAAVPISSIVYTNISGMPGFLLTWFAPSNDLFQVQWTASLSPTNWIAFTNIVSYNTNVFTSPTNTQFNFFDDGSQTGGFGPTRFYRLILLSSTNPPPPPPPPTNTVSISSIVSTNISGMPGFLLTWFAPTNDLFKVQWSTNLVSTNWGTFTNIIAYDVFIGPTNSQFNFFDDGSQTGGTLGPIRFYRLILLGSGSSSNTPPVLPSQTTRIINPLNPLIVTNTATDSDVPAQTLVYSISSTVMGTNMPTINTNTGVISWTPTAAQAGTSNTIITIVTDNGTPPLSTTNSFSVIVNPIPPISSVTITNGGFLLTWFAPTNDIFQVQFTDSLFPANWTNIGSTVSYTGPPTTTNGLFTFLDNGSYFPFTGLRFYRLNLVGVSTTVTTPTITSIFINTNGVNLQWSAPTNEEFQVRWTTNLTPLFTWTLFPNIITSTNGTFLFTDTNAPLLIKFYQLILLP